MRKFILLFFLFLPFASVLKGQIINSKSELSISAGNVIFGGTQNLFFPKGLSSNGLSFKVDYLQTIYPWLKIGPEASFVLPGATGKIAGGFANITTENEKIITGGLSIVFAVPYKESGWRNRIRLQFGIAPVFVSHSGQRTLTIDNTVINQSSHQNETAVIVMNGTSALGLSLTPAVEYYVDQRIGVKLSWNSLITSLKSELTTEQVRMNSINLGIILPLTRSKQINY